MAQLPSLNLAPDTPVDGFTNPASLQPSALLIRQYADSADQIVRALEPHLSALAACDPAVVTDCPERFLYTWGQRVFRRPMTQADVILFLPLFEGARSPEQFMRGVRASLRAMLQSPAFLYRIEVGVAQSEPVRALSQYELATRLSYMIWLSTPDDALLEAAERGALHRDGELSSQVHRMLASPKSRRGSSRFMSQWLRLESLGNVHRPKTSLPESLRTELVASAQRHAENIFREGTAITLLTSTRFPATPDVAALLGVTSSGPGWQWYDVDPAERAGVLTHPAVLARHAYDAYPSPVLRGVYILGRLLCAPPSPAPPGTVQTLPETDVPEGVTNRVAYIKATRGRGCSRCHTAINNLGFAFEGFDSLGRRRTLDNGVPVDDGGRALGLHFGGAVDLSKQISSLDQYQACVVEKWLKFALGQTPTLSVKEHVLSEFQKRGMRFRTLPEITALQPSFAQLLETD
jgi:hypothetical protein